MTRSHRSEDKGHKGIAITAHNPHKLYCFLSRNVSLFDITSKSRCRLHSVLGPRFALPVVVRLEAERDGQLIKNGLNIHRHGVERLHLGFIIDL